MHKSRFSEEQILAIRDQEAGSTTTDICRKHGISSAAFYKSGRRSLAAWTSPTPSAFCPWKTRTQI